MPRITARSASGPPLVCGACGDALAMAHYWLCPSCASLEENALGRAAYHSGRADDLRGVGRHEAARAADQADHWAAALAREWTL